jgi:hypothetical protein
MTLSTLLPLLAERRGRHITARVAAARLGCSRSCAGRLLTVAHREGLVTGAGRHPRRWRVCG